MSDYYGMSAILASMESELTQTMTIDGVETPYPCLIGDRTDTHELGLGGYANNAVVEVVCRRDLFTDETLPALNDLVNLNYRQHKIVSMVISPDGSCVVLQCEDVNKAA